MIQTYIQEKESLESNQKEESNNSLDDTKNTFTFDVFKNFEEDEIFI